MDFGQNDHDFSNADEDMKPYKSILGSKAKWKKLFEIISNGAKTNLRDT